MKELLKNLFIFVFIILALSVCFISGYIKLTDKDFYKYPQAKNRKLSKRYIFLPVDCPTSPRNTNMYLIKDMKTKDTEIYINRYKYPVSIGGQY